MKILPKEEAIELLKRELKKRKQARVDRERSLAYEHTEYLRSQLWKKRRA